MKKKTSGADKFTNNTVGRHTLEKWAREAGAVRKLNNVVLINTEKLDAFIEANAEEEDY